MAGPQAKDLHLLRQLDQELRVALKMVDAGRIASGKGRHRFDALPVRDRHELGLALAILPERLDPQRCLDQRLDPGLIVVGLVLICLLGLGAATPDPSNGRTLRTALVLHGSCSSGLVAHQAQMGSIATLAWPGIGPGELGATRAQAAAEDCTGAGMSASSISRARTAAGRPTKPS